MISVRRDLMPVCDLGQEAKGEDECIVERQIKEKSKLIGYNSG